MAPLTKKIRKLTLGRATFPIFIAVLISTAAAPINIFIISGVGKNSVEAIGTSSGIMFQIGTLVFLAVSGSTIIIGQYIGAKKNNKMLKEATHTTFFILLIGSLFIVVVLLASSEPLLLSWGLKKGPVLDDAQFYMLLMAPTFILVTLTQYFSSILNVYGYSKLLPYLGFFSVALDILLSAVFVYALNLGILGVVLGSILARIFSCFFAGFLYHWKLEPIWKIRSWNWQMAKKIIKISCPISVEKANYNVTMFVLGILIGNIAANIGMVVYGHNYMIWARAIFHAIIPLVLIGGLAFSIGLQTVLSRVYGSKDFTTAKKIVYKAFFGAVFIDLCVALSVFLLQSYIISFLTQKETNLAAVKLLKKVLYASFGWLILLEIGRVANLVFIAATRSAGDTTFTALMSIIVSWTTTILLSWILMKYTSLKWEGVVIAMTIDECIRGLFNFWRWKWGYWKKHIHKISGEKKEILKEVKNVSINPSSRS